jgi:predicted Zn-dependent protease
VLAGFATTELSTCLLAASSGTRRRPVQPTGSLQLVGRTPDGTRSAWAGFASAALTASDLARLDARITARLATAERRIELPAGRYEVLLPPDAVADLMIVLGDAASGRDAHDGRSVFSSPGGRTRIDDAIAPLPFRLESDPRRPGIECIPFLAATSSGTDVSVFDDGSPIGACRWIEGGRLERLRYHRVGAERASQPFTPPVDNLALDLPGATDSLDDLIARTERGLLLTCLWYIREVDVSTLLLTGLTRDGVYLVENGEVVGSVNNFRFNESPVDLLARAVEAGRSERALSREWGEWMNRTIMPALRVEGFNMSSVSPAN